MNSRRKSLSQKQQQQQQQRMFIIFDVIKQKPTASEYRDTFT